MPPRSAQNTGLISFTHTSLELVFQAAVREAAIHSARRYRGTAARPHIVVKLDFSNAFNSLHRFDMLSAVHSRIPDLYSYCCLLLGLQSTFCSILRLTHCFVTGRSSAGGPAGPSPVLQHHSSFVVFLEIRFKTWLHG